MTLLTELVLGMIAIAIATSALGVVQTYISTEVGQRVMHDLRVRGLPPPPAPVARVLHAHARGRVQSRIANEHRRIDNVATSTATSIAQKRWRR